MAKTTEFNAGKKEPAKNPKGTITLSSALALIASKSSISKMGLRTAAIRDGFRSEISGIGKEKILIDEVKFKKWIKDTFQPLPVGYALLSNAAGDLHITSTYVYALIKKNNIKIKKIGAGRGRVYVNFPALQKVFNAKHTREKK